MIAELDNAVMLLTTENQRYKQIQSQNSEEADAWRLKFLDNDRKLVTMQRQALDNDELKQKLVEFEYSANQLRIQLDVLENSSSQKDIQIENFKAELFAQQRHSSDVKLL